MAGLDQHDARNDRQTRVVLTAAARLNQPLATQDLPARDHPLAHAYDDKIVSFELAALDFTSPANNRYSYRLVGFESAWVDAGALHRATYTNLGAGDYVFRVRAANADGAWSTDELSVPVHVSPAPWDRGAFPGCGAIRRRGSPPCGGARTSW